MTKAHKKFVENELPASVEPQRTKSKSISDEEMERFRSFLKGWVSVNCRNSDGKLMDQRSIGRLLGVTSTEYAEWSAEPRAKARPGIRALIKLRETTGVSIDAMLGYETADMHGGLIAKIQDWESQLQEIESQAKKFVESAPRVGEARAYLKEVQRLRYALVGTIAAQQSVTEKRAS